MAERIKPYGRIYTREEVRRWERETLNGAPPKLDIREAERCAALRREEERASKIASALSERRKELAA